MRGHDGSDGGDHRPVQADGVRHRAPAGTGAPAPDAAWCRASRRTGCIGGDSALRRAGLSSVTGRWPPRSSTLICAGCRSSAFLRPPGPRTGRPGSRGRRPGRSPGARSFHPAQRGGDCDGSGSARGRATRHGRQLRPQRGSACPDDSIIADREGFARGDDPAAAMAWLMQGSVASDRRQKVHRQPCLSLMAVIAQRSTVPGQAAR